MKPSDTISTQVSYYKIASLYWIYE